MKTMKYTAAVLSFVLLLSCIFSFSVSAADVTYSATNVSGKQGNTVIVTVKISSDKKIWGANVSLGYNSSELQYVSSEMGDSASQGSLFNTGSAVNFSGTFSNTSGTVFTVTFKVLKSSGTSSVTLKSTENIDYNGASYSCSSVNGSVTVLPASTVMGDADGNGNVDALDVRYALQHAARFRTLTGVKFSCSDMNGDGEITATDVRYILQKAAGLI